MNTDLELAQAALPKPVNAKVVSNQTVYLSHGAPVYSEQQVIDAYLAGMAKAREIYVQQQEPSVCSQAISDLAQIYGLLKEGREDDAIDYCERAAGNYELQQQEQSQDEKDAARYRGIRHLACHGPFERRNFEYAWFDLWAQHEPGFDSAIDATLSEPTP